MCQNSFYWYEKHEGKRIERKTCPKSSFVESEYHVSKCVQIHNHILDLFKQIFDNHKKKHGLNKKNQYNILF
jgi:hypothetical protein